MKDMVITAAILLLGSIVSFLFSVSKKRMGMLYLAIFLFITGVVVAAYAAYQYISVKVDF